ncbi:hypothetical protein RJT34_05296 [Clitoria ternatea]|uniref:Uncharacterized protein n=1 Tax=Clitoria ternatea TaxID=43366 RepID=A0AAN9PSX5_CLITE
MSSMSCVLHHKPLNHRTITTTASGAEDVITQLLVAITSQSRHMSTINHGMNLINVRQLHCGALSCFFRASKSCSFVTIFKGILHYLQSLVTLVSIAIAQWSCNDNKLHPGKLFLNGHAR